LSWWKNDKGQNHRMICIYWIILYDHIFVILIKKKYENTSLFLWVMVFNTTFSNIMAISFISGGYQREGPWENHRHVASNSQIYYIMLYQVFLTMNGIQITTLMVIGTDCIGSCKSNYRLITTTKGSWVFLIC